MKFYEYGEKNAHVIVMNDKSIDDVIQWKFLNKFTNGDTESARLKAILELISV